LDCDEYKGKRRRFEWNTNEKTYNKQFRFEDITTDVNYEDNLKNIHPSLVNHARIGYDYGNTCRFNTRGLVNCMETGVPNFFFKDCKAPFADGVRRFLIKSRAGIQFTPKRKHDILHTGNGLCNCVKIGPMKR
jgi:hypothetical protein